MNSLHRSCRVPSIVHLERVPLIWTTLLFRDSQANSGERNVGNLLQQHRFLNERIFTFVSKFAAFSAANIELWLHKPPTAHKKVDAKLFLPSCFIYFHINWIFPSEKHETSLGILRVKPELFVDIFGRSSILFSSLSISISPFIYIKSTELLFPFILVDDKINSLLGDGKRIKKYSKKYRQIEYLLMTFSLMKLNSKKHFKLKTFSFGVLFHVFPGSSSTTFKGSCVRDLFGCV